jgi:hypothetical protein
MDLGDNFRHAEFLRGGAVGVAQSKMHPRLGPPPLEGLDLTAQKCLKKVHPGQPLVPQLLKGLAQGMQLAEVPPSHSISPGRHGTGCLLVNTESGADASLLRSNHFFRHPFIDLGMGISR